MMLDRDEEEVVIVGAKRYRIIQLLRDCFIKDNQDDNQTIRYGLEDEDCAICLEKLFDDEPITIKEVVESKSCMHVFHLQCITKWTQTDKTCPLCRLRLHQLNKRRYKVVGYDHRDTIVENRLYNSRTIDFIPFCTNAILAALHVTYRKFSCRGLYFPNAAAELAEHSRAYSPRRMRGLTSSMQACLQYFGGHLWVSEHSFFDTNDTLSRRLRCKGLSKEDDYTTLITYEIEKTYPIMASNKEMISSTSSVPVWIFCSNNVQVILQKLHRINIQHRSLRLLSNLRGCVRGRGFPLLFKLGNKSPFSLLSSTNGTLTEGNKDGIKIPYGSSKY
ncbi:hypothetical protein F8388_000851 [Cannabis sativa]|uniref:RING-type domain-containing protein n=1 Tax=Cannabis sativa TaxID=3483 RepID=A0A7J6FPQ0_CANSA|nr:hypothetical protein F8388_000851 [Cannabis sativa]